MSPRVWLNLWVLDLSSCKGSIYNHMLRSLLPRINCHNSMKFLLEWQQIEQMTLMKLKQSILCTLRQPHDFMQKVLFTFKWDSFVYFLLHPSKSQLKSFLFSLLKSKSFTVESQACFWIFDGCDELVHFSKFSLYDFFAQTGGNSDFLARIVFVLLWPV